MKVDSKASLLGPKLLKATDLWGPCKYTAISSDLLLTDSVDLNTYTSFQNVGISFNPLPDDKILAKSKLNILADNKLNITQNIQVVFLE